MAEPHPQGRSQAAAALGLAALATAATVVLFAGARRFTDDDYVRYLVDLAQGAPAVLQARKTFLLEGLLPDALIYGLGAAGLAGTTAAYVVWCAGVGLLALTLAAAVRDRALSPVALLALLAFSRIADTLSLWIGKPDPLLMAFLVMSASRRRALGWTGAALAALTHPMLALVSASGLLLVQYLRDGRGRWGQAALTLGVAVADLALVKALFPHSVGREGYFLAHLPYVALRGLQVGAPAFVSGIVAPVAALLALGARPLGTGPLGKALPVLWLAGVGVLTSVLTLDHTRDACLATLAPFVAFLDGQPLDLRLRGRPFAGWVVVALFAMRLTSPHFDESGAQLFHWRPLAGWTERRIQRLRDADRAACAGAPSACAFDP